MTDYHEIVVHSENFLGVILINLSGVDISEVVSSPNDNITCDVGIMLYFLESLTNSLCDIRSTCHAQVFYPLLNMKDFRYHNVKFYLVFSNIEFFLQLFSKIVSPGTRFQCCSEEYLKRGCQVQLLLLRESQFLVHHVSTHTPSWHVCIEGSSC